MSTSTPAAADSGEDVTDFLRRIKELGEQRDREDAERTRKLEDEIMEGRRQREVRRAGPSRRTISAVLSYTVLTSYRTCSIPLT